MDTQLWQRAVSFAARAHRHQLRKDGITPYVAHPFRVAMIVRTVFGCDDDVAITAALLHDTIEDTATDYDELAELFGPAIAEMVASLTKNMAMPEPEREADYDRRLAASADWRVRLVKLADLYDNLSDRYDLTADGLHKDIEKAGRWLPMCERERRDHAPLERAAGAIHALVATISPSL